MMSFREVGADDATPRAVGVPLAHGHSGEAPVASAPTKSVYVPPAWSTPPKFAMSLEVLKGGAVVDTVDLSQRPYYIVGRQAGAVDIVCAHDSVSRQHAALQFGEHGELYVSDLASTHGTRLNKVRLVPKVYNLVYTGAVLQFGESTRLFVVQGPPEFLPPETTTPELEAARAASHARQARKAAERAEAASVVQPGAQVESTGVTWGMRDEEGMEAEEDEEDDEDGMGDQSAYNVGMRRLRQLRWCDDVAVDKLSDKEQPLLERLNTRRARLQHVCQEIERVKHGGRAALSRDTRMDDDDTHLSSGQLTQLARLEESIEKLLPLVDEDHAALRARLHAKNLLPRSAAKRQTTSARISELVREWEADSEVQDVSATARAAGHSRVATGGVFTRQAGKGLVLRIARPAAVVGRQPGVTDNRVSVTAGSESSARAHAQHSDARAPSMVGASHRSGAATFEELSASLLDVERESASIAMQLSGSGSGDMAGTPVAEDASALPADADELECFMARTSATVQHDEQARLTARYDHLQVEASRLRRLIDITRPVELQLAPAPTACAPTSTAQPPAVAHPSRASSGAAAHAMVTPEVALHPVASNASGAVDGIISPARAARRVLGPMLPPSGVAVEVGDKRKAADDMLPPVADSMDSPDTRGAVLHSDMSGSTQGGCITSAGGVKKRRLDEGPADMLLA